MEFAALLTRRAISSPRDGPASGTEESGTTNSGTANGTKGAQNWTNVSNGSKDEDGSLNPQTINPQPSTFNPQPASLNPQP